MNAFESAQEQKLRDAMTRTNGDSLWACMSVIRDAVANSDEAEAKVRSISKVVAACAKSMDLYALARGLDDSERSKEQIARIRHL